MARTTVLMIGKAVHCVGISAKEGKMHPHPGYWSSSNDKQWKALNSFDGNLGKVGAPIFLKDILRLF